MIFFHFYFLFKIFIFFWMTGYPRGLEIKRVYWLVGWSHGSFLMNGNIWVLGQASMCTCGCVSRRTLLHCIILWPKVHFSTASFSLGRRVSKPSTLTIGPRTIIWGLNFSLSHVIGTFGNVNRNDEIQSTVDIYF